MLSDLYWRGRWWLEWHVKRQKGKVRDHNDARRIAECPLFDVKWYLEMYPDIATSGVDPAMHYLRYGAAEGRDPGPGFSTIGYVQRYPDVTNSGVNPLLHYMDVGAAEGRQPATRSTQLTGYRVVCISGEPDSVGYLYRVANLVSAMQAAGAQATSMTIESAVRNPQIIAEASLLVLWRTAFDDSISALLKIVRTSGAVVMFDADDLVIEPQLAKIEIIDGIRTQRLSESEVEAYYQRTLLAFEAADWGCCSTEELASAMRIRGMPTFVLPNGFTDAAHRRARFAVRSHRSTAGDGLVRIGYAAGTRTHQCDFAHAARAVASVLKQRANCRLVLFRRPGTAEPLLDLSEFQEFTGLANRIEWRELVPQDDLSSEIVRFDVNIAPVEVGNPFCEAKSEMKFVEAALVDVCTVASPTGPFRRAIRHGETGFLAETFESWESTLLRLIDDPKTRGAAGRAAHRDVLWKYGAHRRTEAAAAILDQTLGSSREAARAGVFQMHCRPEKANELLLPKCEPLFEADRLKDAEITVIIPLYNYDRFVTEALESVATQTVQDIDLIVVDDGSTDNSLAVADSWIRAHADRFNRVLLLSNAANAGLGPTRNVAIDAAETTYVLPLDADNRLLPKACETLLSSVRKDQAAFVYPLLRQFGQGEAIMGKEPYSPELLVGGNTIDAMVIMRKDCWAAVGGYARLEPQGWEDFDFWCRVAEMGMWGRQHPETLAEYRVHERSMQKVTTDIAHQKEELLNVMQKRHPWLSHVQSFKRIPNSRNPQRDGASLGVQAETQTKAIEQ
jgi:glycosyltransferase involved in cell wall biosynthesis